MIRIGMFLLCLAPFYAAFKFPCKDVGPWCHSQRHLCEKEVYKGFMNEKCRKTCDFCNNETPVCETASCQHNCDVRGGKASCSCFPGYVLNRDGRTCVDIDECLFESSCTDPSLPVCRNTKGSYVCTTCQGRPGQTTYYQSNKCCLKSDLRSCGQNSMTGVPIPPGQNNILGLWPWTVRASGCFGASSFQTLVSVRGRPCVGALISSEWIAVPGHCFSSMNGTADVVARVGIRSTNHKDANLFSREIEVDRVVVHGDYSFPNNDIALVHLASEVETSWAARAICLPNGEAPRDSSRCWLSGFEALYSNNDVYRTLKDSSMTITPSSVCSEHLGGVGRKSHINQTLCARYERGSDSSCAGETGGVLVCQRCNSCDFFLAGIMTFGDRCSNNDRSYGAFASIENFEEWISNVTQLPVNKNGACSSMTSSRQASWQSWGRTSSCSRTCGGGWHSRSRVCNNGEPGGPGCKGKANETSGCNPQPCPKWSEYGSWSTCSATCGEGTTTRNRTCINGSVGQTGCHDGSEHEMKSCRVKRCPYWGRWSQWTDCDRSCGDEGAQYSRRECIGAGRRKDDCVGEDLRRKPCNRKPCPQWSDWSAFSACPATCGAGVVKISYRVCVHGSNCQGPSQQTLSCGLPPCAGYQVRQTCNKSRNLQNNRYCKANSHWCGNYQYGAFMRTHCYRTCCLLGRL